MKIKHTAKVQNGKFIFSNKERFLEDVKAQEGKTIKIVLDSSRERSPNQNRYYWGVLIKLIEEHTGEERNDIHEFLKSQFLQEKKEFFGVLYAHSGSTKELKTVDFESYLEKCRRWASDFLMLQIPLPNEIEI